MERATLAEGRQDGMARVRAAAARTNAAGGGGGATVLVVEREALVATLLSLDDEMEPVMEAAKEGTRVEGAAAEVVEGIGDKPRVRMGGEYVRAQQ